MNKDFSLYFFALVPPKDIQKSVTEIKQEFKLNFEASHALKSPPHITLIPPFKFEQSKEHQLISSLIEFSKNEWVFQQKLDGFGTFPPRVIFIKVNKTKTLDELHQRLMQYMDNVFNIRSLIRGVKKFSPHMSVAFRDLTRENFYRARTIFEKRAISFEFCVDGITLLRHNKINWEILHTGFFKR